MISIIPVAGILAATMSTADSQLLAASSSASENIMKSVFGIKLSEKKSMLVARIALIIIAVIAVVIAWDKNSTIFGVVSFAWAGFGATFGPVMLLALFWKRSNKFNIYELLPAFVIAIAADIIISLVTKAPDNDITEDFNGYVAEVKEKV